MTFSSFLDVLLFFDCLYFIRRWKLYNLPISVIPILGSTMKKLLSTTRLLNCTTMIMIIPKWYKHILIQSLVIFFYFLTFSITYLLCFPYALESTICSTSIKFTFQYIHFQYTMASQCFDTFLYMLTNICDPNILVSLKCPMDVQSSDCQFPT